MIKTGLIGNGYWGKKISDKLDYLSDKIFVQTTANYNPDQFGKAKWIFIATPAVTHFKIAKEVIEKGVNVFVEKPFCSNTGEALKLVNLARKNKIHLYVDNVFLFRKELLGLVPGEYRNVKFHWYKNGPFNDTLINDLLYHDLYLLIYILGEKKIRRVSVIKNEKDILNFSFCYGESEIKIDYNRSFGGIKEKAIQADDVLIKFNETKEDSLMKIISKCLDDEMDFEFNNKLNLSTSKLFDILSSKIKF